MIDLQHTSFKTTLVKTHDFENNLAMTWKKGWSMFHPKPCQIKHGFSKT